MDANTQRRAERLVALVEERKDDASFREAKEFLEGVLAHAEDADALRAYGYIHECRGVVLTREAIRFYERSLEADPSAENKAHHQLIHAYGRLDQRQLAVDRYKARLADAPDEVAWYRYLVQAYLSAAEYEEAGEVIGAGLKLDPDDSFLLESKGSILASRGRPDEALAVWLQAFELNPNQSISPRYSRVFLLERLGRLAEAAQEWEAIISWLRERNYDVQTEWPKRELARLRGLIETTQNPD